MFQKQCNLQKLKCTLTFKTFTRKKFLTSQWIPENNDLVYWKLPCTQISRTQTATIQMRNSHSWNKIFPALMPLSKWVGLSLNHHVPARTVLIPSSSPRAVVSCQGDVGLSKQLSSAISLNADAAPWPSEHNISVTLPSSKVEFQVSRGDRGFLSTRRDCSKLSLRAGHDDVFSFFIHLFF